MGSSPRDVASPEEAGGAEGVMMAPVRSHTWLLCMRLS